MELCSGTHCWSASHSLTVWVQSWSGDVWRMNVQLRYSRQEGCPADPPGHPCKCRLDPALLCCRSRWA